MKNKILIGFTLVIYAFFSSCQSNEVPNSNPKLIQEDVILVEYPEVYELANIIIALTEDGIQDKWKVKKGFSYYDEMRTYFKPMEGHPLLDSVNFIRERWEEFLSFRTDAYAFRFDENNNLKRMNDFHSFGITEFDDHIKLVQDFAEKSNFRQFFKENEAFHNDMINAYKNQYMLHEMKDFLSDHFDDMSADSKFVVVLSPFVGSQHLLREMDSLTNASFADIASQLINGDSFNDEEKSSNIHTLFTEMDHAYVNPTSANYELNSSFKNVYWNNESGYDEYERGVFNEYMTWAVFDLFNSKHFPELAEKINLNWHFQNETRGFDYSNLFASKLKSLYNKYDGKKKIKDLYPELLEWTKSVQTTLSKPQLLNDSDTLWIDLKKKLVRLDFSEPMDQAESFDIVLKYGQWDNEVINIGAINNLNWDKSGKSLTFELEFPQKEEYYLLLNWWGVKEPLKSKKGVMIQATSGLTIKKNPS